MSGENADLVARRTIEAVYRDESRRVFATLVRLLGDFDLAEEALHEAFAAAVERWPVDGVPTNPRAWLVSAGRFKGIDAIRRRVQFDRSVIDIAERFDLNSRAPDPAAIDDTIEDDRLRLIFTCCHPALPAESRVALTLREVCGLTTDQIAAAFLTTPPTIAQRIVRAKAKIKNARIPYQVPTHADLPDRLETILHVIYVVFSEGYAASSGESVIDADLSDEAIRLARLLCELLAEPEVKGVLALMLLHEARRTTRTTPDGDLVLLEDQDRTQWSQKLIREGSSLVTESLASGRIGPYTLQAAIAAVHAEAASTDTTDWAQIVALYGVLLRLDPSPIIELNRAVAIAMRDGPEAGVTLIEAILARGDLTEYHLAYAAKADLCRRSKRMEDAKAAYISALTFVRQVPERRFLEKRLRDLND